VIDFSVEIQLNVDGSAGDLGEVAYTWIDDLVTATVGDKRAILAPMPVSASAARKNLGEGDYLGLIRVTRPDPAGGFLAKEKERTLSDLGLAWLRRELTDFPESVLVTAGPIFMGLPGGDLGTSIQTYPESPGWLQMGASFRSSSFDESGQRQWLERLRSFADRWNPGFGHISYDYSEGMTALENRTDHVTWGVERTMPQHTIGQSRAWLRGYSWLTIVPQELAGKVGGAAGLRATGAFVQVDELRNGGLWLLATENFQDYGIEAATPVFRALAPILPPGLPKMYEGSPNQPPVVLVPADPQATAG